jgi:hypothetical protein
MTRKHILAILCTIMMVTMLGLILNVLFPLWFPVLMIRPQLITPLSNLITKNMLKVMMGMLFTRPKQEATQPIERIPE